MFREYGLGYKSIGRFRTYLLRIRGFIEQQFLSHYFGAPPRWRMFIRRYGGKRTLPDFCLIGPFKSGSSDMGVNLCLHPAIMMPIAKEFHQRHPEAWRIYYPTEKEKQQHAKVHGSALSPFLAPFLHGMERTYRLSQIKPDAKIILILRDPAQRVYSHWKWEYFLAGQRTVNDLPFLQTFPAYVDKALSVFPENLMYTACASQGLHTSIYVNAVKYWIECFGRDQVLVLDTAEYWQSRSPTLHKIHDFIGIPRYDVPESSFRINENPLTNLPPADDESIAKLQAFFRPYNEELWEAIGARFDW
jgi:hypothetical protein